MQIIAGSREKYGIHSPGFFTKSVPYFDALPQGADSCRPHFFAHATVARTSYLYAGSREKRPRTILRTVPCASNYKHGYNTHNPAAEPLRRSAPRGRFLSTTRNLNACASALSMLGALCFIYGFSLYSHQNPLITCLEYCIMYLHLIQVPRGKNERKKHGHKVFNCRSRAHSDFGVSKPDKL